MGQVLVQQAPLGLTSLLGMQVGAIGHPLSSIGPMHWIWLLEQVMGQVFWHMTLFGPMKLPGMQESGILHPVTGSVPPEQVISSGPQVTGQLDMQTLPLFPTVYSGMQVSGL